MEYSKNKQDFHHWPQPFSFEEMYEENLDLYLKGLIGLNTLRLRNSINRKYLKNAIYMDNEITGWKLIDKILVIK